MGALEMYAEQLANWISGGAITAKTKLSAVGIKPLYDKYLTKEFLVKAWAVEGLPVNFEFYLTDLIRGHMNKICPEVKIVIHTYSTPSVLNANNEQFKRQFAKSSDMFHRYEEAFSTLREDEQLTGKLFRTGRGSFSLTRKQLDKIKDQYTSYKYVYEKLLEGSGLYQTSFFIQGYASNVKQMGSFTRELESLMDSQGILFRSLKGNISAYLRQYGVAGYPDEEGVKVRKLLCSSENLTTFIPNRTTGLVNKEGILMGVDVKNDMPVLINYFESGAGQTLLFVAQTGGGKTIAAFLFAINLIAQGHHCSVIDIKGNEWSRLLNFTDGVVISFDDLNPRFVNTLRLDDIKVTAEDCGFYYRNGVAGTVQLFSLMTSLTPKEGNEVDLEMLVESAVNKLYSKNNVIDSVPESFINSANLKYEEVLEILETFSTSVAYSESQKELIRLIRTRCSMFLSSDGRYGKAFKNEISLGEVLKSPLVIYSFNKNSGAILDRLDAVRIFMAQFIDGKKHFYRKRMKLQSICFFEELQRCIDIPGLTRAIAHKVTGGRSDNVTNVILLNSLGTLQEHSMSDIRSNITTFVIGLLGAQDIDTLVNSYGFYKERERLEELGEERYRNCFYLKFNTGKHSDSCTYRCLIPTDILSLLNTRDVARE